MDYLDLKGKTCPLPVIETKRLLESKDVTQLEILLDDETAQENVMRFLNSRGYVVTAEKTEKTALLRASRERETEQVNQGLKKVLVFIDGETVGRGNDQLGAILMKSFLHTLKDLKPLPWRLIFINAGVKLPVEGSEYLPVLNELENLGVEILSCGTCLDFYRLKDSVRAGKVTNMYDILSSLVEATNILKP